MVCELYLTQVGFSQNKEQKKKNLNSDYIKAEAKDLGLERL